MILLIIICQVKFVRGHHSRLMRPLDLSACPPPSPQPSRNRKNMDFRVSLAGIHGTSKHLLWLYGFINSIRFTTVGTQADCTFLRH